jgi:hypothetical protein
MAAEELAVLGLAAVGLMPALFVGGVIGAGCSIAFLAINIQEEADKAAKNATVPGAAGSKPSMTIHSPMERPARRQQERTPAMVIASIQERRFCISRGFAGSFA